MRRKIGEGLFCQAPHRAALCHAVVVHFGLAPGSGLILRQRCSHRE